MSRQSLTRHRVGVLGDVDKATVQRVLDGKPVHSMSLDKLAHALGVARSEIPDD